MSRRRSKPKTRRGGSRSGLRSADGNRRDDLTVRTYGLRLDTLDVDSRSIEVVIATEDPVVVLDMQRWEPVQEILLMSGCELPADRQVPMLDTHDMTTVQKLLGSTRDLRVEGSRLLGRNVFSRKAAANDAFGDVRDGHLSDNSIGYRVFDHVMIEAGQTHKVDGRTFTAGPDRPLRISTKWRVVDNSVCSIGKDPGAKNRNNNLEISAMDVKNKKNQNKVDDGAGVAAQDEGVKLEKERIAFIKAMRGETGVSAELVDQLVRDGISLDESREKLYEAMRNHEAPRVGSPALPDGSGIEVGADRNLESIPDAVVDAICMRAGVPSYKTDIHGGLVLDGSGKPELREEHGRARQFAEMRVPDIARFLLGQAGVADSATMSDRRAVSEAMRLSQRATSTLSLPDVLANVTGRTLRAAYFEFPAQWPKFCRQTSHGNFKEIRRVHLHEAGHLGKIAPGGEYGYGTIGDSAETFKLLKYGEIIGVLWEILVNDDLNALTELPRKLGSAARRKEDELAFGVLTANAAMADGTALFHADHSNLGSALAISVASLDAGRLAMRKQTSRAGNTGTAYVVMDPKVLVVPCALEGAAEKIMRSEYDPDDANGKTTNIWKGELKVCFHPVLDETSATNWYMSCAADQGGIEMCFLDGFGAPRVDRENDFGTDVTRYKIRHVVAAAAIDHRCLHKNPYAG